MDKDQTGNETAMIISDLLERNRAAKRLQQGNGSTLCGPQIS